MDDNDKYDLKRELLGPEVAKRVLGCLPSGDRRVYAAFVGASSAGSTRLISVWPGFGIGGLFVVAILEQFPYRKR